MDDLLIDEKRYISSKRAAKITGYAKDYVGQLCREGRVPARLVGRSWYVLESAIQDHRFGNAAVVPEEKKVLEPAVLSLISNSTGPRYTSAIEDPLPTMRELTSEVDAQISAPEASDFRVDLQDSWESWFERIDEPKPEPEPEQGPVIIRKDEPSEFPTMEEGTGEVTEEKVPVRAIHHSLYRPTEENEMPRILKISPKQELPLERVVPEKKTLHMSATRSIQLASVLIASVAVVIAIIGSGYFDKYIISNRPVALIAGVSLYNK